MIANKELKGFFKDYKEDVLMEYRRLLFVHKIVNHDEINMVILRIAAANVAEGYRPKHPGNQLKAA